MKTFWKVISGLIVLGIIALVGIVFIPVQRTKPISNLALSYRVPEGRGKYIAQLADCAACHTARHGKPYAGGREIVSPLGTIWSTNITPDKETGIGAYSLDEFRAALYDGLAKNGSHLYPAMPYENYRNLTEEDIVALYEYFMKEVPPINKVIPATSLAFPFDQRWGIRLWNWIAMERAGPVQRYKDEKLDRGAYLVEGPGHCGACHTPRDMFFRQASLTGDAASFLSGGEIDEWAAPDLRGPNSAVKKWSTDDLKLYLSSGRNSHSAVVSEMTLVVQESLQYATDQDLDAIVSYLRHIASKDPVPSTTKDPQKTIKLLTDADSTVHLGARLYLDNCNACHFVDGKGASQVFPALSGNSLVVARQKRGLIDLILHGARMPSTKMRPADIAMPGFDWRLNDEEVAALATFVRGAWANDADPITAQDVAVVRAKKKLE